MSFIPRDLIQHLEWKPGQPTPARPAVTPASVTPAVQSESDYWSVSGVQYREGIHTVDLSSKLLDSGSTKTQDQWAHYSLTAMDAGEFHTPDYPLLYGLVKALHASSNDPAYATNTEAAQKFLKDMSRAHWLMTLTRVRYQPNGDDLIIHNYGQRSFYEVPVDFITPDEWIKNTSKPVSYQALLGTTDSVQDINEVFRWLNGTDTYTWKVNAKPSEITDRVAWFDADSVRVGLDCDWVPAYSYSSLGVRIRAQKTGGLKI